jgi:hypothetical protein
LRSLGHLAEFLAGIARCALTIKQQRQRSEEPLFAIGSHADLTDTLTAESPDLSRGKHTHWWARPPILRNQSPSQRRQRQTD